MTTNESPDPPGSGRHQERTHRERELQRRIFLVLPGLRRRLAGLREFSRRVRGAPHVVEFFHQIDDPYSHLALEAARHLTDLYDIEFRFYLVSQTDRAHAPEPELLEAYARRDCAWIAPHYGLEFPADAPRPQAEKLERVAHLLSGLTEHARFVDVAIAAGRALWNQDEDELTRLEGIVPLASDEKVAAALETGNARRERLRHYSGGMFWYAGEWYWGVDRLYHLERRLIDLGAARGQTMQPRFDRPPLDVGSVSNARGLELEIFPSLRSPYTAVIFERSLALAASVDVPVRIRPVMPMVMRGVPVPQRKGLYIMLDAVREADTIDVPFGNMFDPVGHAVERGFSLWPFAHERGRGAEYVSAFLRAAFFEGRPTGTDEGIRAVVEEAGLSFEEAQSHLDSDSWRDELEANRITMYEELGVWGVPSYRLRGPDGEPDLCVWGQDRLWLVAAEIRRRLGEAGEPDPQDNADRVGSGTARTEEKTA